MLGESKGAEMSEQKARVEKIAAVEVRANQGMNCFSLRYAN